MKKPGIPPVPKPGEDRTRFDQAIKESLEIVMGRRGTPIQRQDFATGSDEQLCAKVNEILGVMQG